MKKKFLGDMTYWSVAYHLFKAINKREKPDIPPFSLGKTDGSCSKYANMSGKLSRVKMTHFQ